MERSSPAPPATASGAPASEQPRPARRRGIRRDRRGARDGGNPPSRLDCPAVRHAPARSSPAACTGTHAIPSTLDLTGLLAGTALAARSGLAAAVAGSA
jgi:hypothetical protein